MSLPAGTGSSRLALHSTTLNGTRLARCGLFLALAARMSRETHDCCDFKQSTQPESSVEKCTSRVRLHRKPRPHLDPGGGWLKAQAHGFTSWLWDSREKICCHPWPPGPSHRDHIGITGSSLFVCLPLSFCLSLFFCPGLPERDLLWAWAKDILGCISNPSQSKVPGPRKEVTRDTASREPTTSRNVSSSPSSVTCCTVIYYPEL